MRNLGILVLGLVLFTVSGYGQNLSKVRIGNAAEWVGTIAIVIHQGSLFTVEQDGVLYRTDLSNGRWRAIGKPEFGGTDYLFSAANRLISLEGGSLYFINPETGAWQMLGGPGEWANTETGNSFGTNIYTIESDGTLYETNATTGRYRAFPGNYKGTLGILAAEGLLWTVEAGGNIWRVKTSDGSWELLPVSVPNSIAGTNNGRILYLIDEAGALHRLDGQAGTKQVLGSPIFGNTAWMGFLGQDLIILEKDGSLYRVRVN